MTIVAQTFDHVVGVDTHARTHTYCIIEAPTGLVTLYHQFDTTPKALARAINWIKHHTSGRTLVAIEGTGCYGADLARRLEQAGIEVCEVQPPKRAQRRARGKSDLVDAEAAARSALAVHTSQLAQVRASGIRAALSVLITARQLVSRQHSANINALTGLLRRVDLGFDARRALTSCQIKQVASWRAHRSDTVEQAYGRLEASRLAKTIIQADRELVANKTRLTSLVNQLAPGLVDEPGFGPVTCAQILVAYSHHGRFSSEAGFAGLAGVNPLPASSGNTVRYRLNRGGDRQLNHALDTIIKTRLRCHPETMAYLDKRTKQGLTYRETKRLLKRYLARHIYRVLQKYDTLTP